MSKSLAFTERDLRRAAGERSFERGLAYRDCVYDVEITASEITARVAGSAEYDVTLTMDDDGVTGECSCPYGLEGNFCKHCVAVGLALLSEVTSLQSLQSAAQAKAQSLNDWLTSLTRQELLDLVRKQVAEDRDLRRRLELRSPPPCRSATCRRWTPRPARRLARSSKRSASKQGMPGVHAERPASPKFGCRRGARVTP